MSVNYVALGKRIGYFRMQCGNITQEALASKINRSREFLAKIEKGTEHPSIATLVDIADALCISVDDLLIHNFYAVVISERKTIQCQDNLFIIILNAPQRSHLSLKGFFRRHISGHLIIGQHAFLLCHKVNFSRTIFSDIDFAAPS